LPAFHFPKAAIRVTALLLAGTACRALADDIPADATHEQIVITASRPDMLGKATTASQGTISREEVELRPIYRASQLFEAVPGLVVTIHSGEGKAQQYLIRGYNLDHGTDFASFVDDMPVNRPTNAHGQGYSDLNYLMPQIVSGIDYTKGPYYADIGDFGAVASAHTRLVNDLPLQSAVTVGTDGYQDLFGAGTIHLSADQRVLMAADVAHYDGPWQPGQDFRKVNALLRYSQGTATDGFTLTAMAYASDGGLITDQPARAVEQGLIGRFGTLDPYDHSTSQRYSLSAHLDKPLGPGQLAVSLYGIRSTMTLWNDFTHYLDDPVNGDQEEQNESRTTLGGVARWTVKTRLAGLDTETLVGLQVRYDDVTVDRKHTWHRATVLPNCYQEQDDPASDTSGDTIEYKAVGGNCTADKVHLLMLSPYLQETVHWMPWLRTIVGLRADYQHATDHNLVRAPEAAGGNQGDPIDAPGQAWASGGQWLVQPKASVALGPWAKTELYFSYGTGFHSNDVRGVFGFAAGQNTSGTPLLSKTTGLELGLRTNLIPNVNLDIALFQQDFSSELSYNADVGSDDSSGPSRRQGLEVSAQYHPARWLELNTDLAFSKPRYRCPATGSDSGPCAGIGSPDNPGSYIADAPNFIYSAGVLVHNLGRWSGALQWRRLGTHALVDGGLSTTDQAYPWQSGLLARDNGYSEWNLDAGYQFDGGWRLQVSVYNLFNSKDDAADYYYQSRLPGEPAHGYSDFQQHPLEPRSARFTLSRAF
jgi:outer membrane cobalamin receptor